MLQEVLENDEIMEYLIKRTNFTKPQLDTFLISQLNKELDLNGKVYLRDTGRVSKGSFIRTLRQAQKNLEKSLYTIIISEYLGILDKSNIERLVRVGDVLKEFQTRKINREKTQSILKLVSSIILDICGKST